jgi:hypothetical protein
MLAARRCVRLVDSQAICFNRGCGVCAGYPFFGFFSPVQRLHVHGFAFVLPLTAQCKPAPIGKPQNFNNGVICGVKFQHSYFLLLVLDPRFFSALITWYTSRTRVLIVSAWVRWRCFATSASIALSWGLIRMVKLSVANIAPAPLIENVKENGGQQFTHFQG